MQLSVCFNTGLSYPPFPAQPALGVLVWPPNKEEGIHPPNQDQVARPYRCPVLGRWRAGFCEASHWSVSLALWDREGGLLSLTNGSSSLGWPFWSSTAPGCQNIPPTALPPVPSLSILRTGAQLRTTLIETQCGCWAISVPLEQCPPPPASLHKSSLSYLTQ